MVWGGVIMGAAALTYYMTKKDRPIDPFYDFENQTVEIDVIFKDFFNIHTILT
jgi:hypothetical protein